MGQGRILGAGALLLGVAPAAHAGFAINYTVTPGVDALAGTNVFRFYAKNDQTGEQLGSKSLLAMEITSFNVAARLNNATISSTRV